MIIKKKKGVLPYYFDYSAWWLPPTQRCMVWSTLFRYSNQFFFLINKLDIGSCLLPPISTLCPRSIPLVHSA
jgi:hypothetical protein